MTKFKLVRFYRSPLCHRLWNAQFWEGRHEAVLKVVSQINENEATQYNVARIMQEQYGSSD